MIMGRPLGATHDVEGIALGGVGGSAAGAAPAVGCSAEVIEAIPAVVFNREQWNAGKQGAEDASCSVCIEAFEEGDKLRMLSQCSHVFHQAGRFHHRSNIVPQPFHNRSTHRSTTVPQLFHNRSTTVPQPLHNRSRIVPQPFHNRSTIVPQSFHNRSTTVPMTLLAGLHRRVAGAAHHVPQLPRLARAARSGGAGGRRRRRGRGCGRRRGAGRGRHG